MKQRNISLIHSFTLLEKEIRLENCFIPISCNTEPNFFDEIN